MNTNDLCKLSLCDYYCNHCHFLHLFPTVVYCYSAIRLLSRNCEIKLSSVQLQGHVISRSHRHFVTHIAQLLSGHAFLNLIWYADTLRQVGYYYR